MGIFDETVEVARRTMVLFFLIDASGSMSGDKMGTVNNTMEGVVRELEDISNDNADAELKVAVLSGLPMSQFLRRIFLGIILMQEV